VFDDRPTTIAELRAAGLATTAADVRKAALAACQNDRQRKIILSGRETRASAITPCILVPWPAKSWKANPQGPARGGLALMDRSGEDSDFWLLDAAMRGAGISTARLYLDRSDTGFGPMTWRLSFFACRRHEDCRKNHDAGRACRAADPPAAWTRVGAR